MPRRCSFVVCPDLTSNKWYLQCVCVWGGGDICNRDRVSYAHTVYNRVAPSLHLQAQCRYGPHRYERDDAYACGEYVVHQCLGEAVDRGVAVVVGGAVNHHRDGEEEDEDGVAYTGGGLHILDVVSCK